MITAKFYYSLLKMLTIVNEKARVTGVFDTQMENYCEKLFRKNLISVLIQGVFEKL